MREIEASSIASAVARLCIDANYSISGDIKRAFERARTEEETELARDVISDLLENAAIAGEGALPLCQDTGMAVVFVDLGQDVRVTGGFLSDAVNEGVRRGYEEGYLRKSVVADPIRRVNTNDNTPAVIHYDITRGGSLVITVAPKGFGSENMSALAMLKPSQGIEGVKKFIIETVKAAGPNPCPPVIVGVGVGGVMEQACLMAKRALLRPLGEPNPDAFWDGVERELLDSINRLDIGPAGFGGRTTALGVHIRVGATHIAGLPVAVNIGCHATRHASVIL
ncbi:MAG: fumarate hydratase [Synergistaceae bacterium]|jgi:fumarate hydratase subunit alpha|nr:fumarate hydratase [Synergistaceae bacterium]